MSEDLEQRIRDVEQENSNLASLYVALSQLHSSLDVNEVLNVIVEIMLNFVGAETFAVMVVDREQTLRAIAAHGVACEQIPACRADDGVIGGTLSSGHAHVGAFSTGNPAAPLASPPLICIPLDAAGVTIGALPIWTFLEQKTGFTDIDHEIIALMAKSAGTALEAARLAMTAQRKPTSRGYYEAFAPLLA